MKRNNWPVSKEHAERSARPDGTCFYCFAPIGAEHSPSCVIRKRTVKLRVELTAVFEVPEYWNDSDIRNFYEERNCVMNTLSDLGRIGDKGKETLMDGCAGYRPDWWHLPPTMTCAICGPVDLRIQSINEADATDEYRFGIRVQDCES